MSIADTLKRAAADAAGAQQYPAATLYLVATPIGNLADLTLRAIHVLALADAVACEDTRVGAQLLRHLGLEHQPLLPLHRHNEAAAAAAVVERLARGERVAFVSDAGTPAVSDPGARLVAAVRTAGHRVLPLPGPSSVTTALSVAGDVGAQGFAFAGFAPARGRERAQWLQARCAHDDAVVLFEAPHRIEALAAQLAALDARRTVTLCRELTKQFETVVTMPAAELPAWLAADADRRRGEFALVLHARERRDGDDAPAEVAEALRWLPALLAALPLKQAVAIAAQVSGAPRNALYDRALALRQEGGDGAGDD
ncbi:16S rRNA (cytidine(1402)-2'-O)-methyltransferase [Azohydromonas sp.]|uniref:16S rRNA (cytidine(1402)-2'-O)-methyltransferase n=1 Tax=Azohydromonas sp. TaxID=1872666 RepID=UPI002BE90A48|nr:16S rRNA (cytidine(1402)-2'-O)-methyltransferase [Azohydromonas sp.]HMM85529.1 16S rRNA (cytidine(1402)-2'-O)-methyltransferase [Azohydromonas sp.]